MRVHDALAFPAPAMTSPKFVARIDAYDICAADRLANRFVGWLRKVGSSWEGTREVKMRSSTAP
jgi:hypothetical protein